MASPIAKLSWLHQPFQSYKEQSESNCSFFEQGIGDSNISIFTNQSSTITTRNGIQYPTYTCYSPQTKIIYDHRSQRWFTCELNPTKFQLSVSNNMDYSQGNVKFDIPAVNIIDPQIGMNSKWIVISTNSFKRLGSMIFVIDRVKLLQGNLIYKCIETSTLNQCPVIDYDDIYPDFLLVRVISNSSTIISSISADRIDYNPLLAMNTIPQNRSNFIGTVNHSKNSGKITSAIVINNTLSYCHDILNDKSQIQICKVDIPSLKLISSQIISDPSKNYSNPSLAVNKFNDMLVMFYEEKDTLYSYKDRKDTNFRLPVKFSTPSLKTAFTASLDPSDFQSFWLQDEKCTSRILPLTYQRNSNFDYFKQKETQIGTWNTLGRWSFRDYPTFFWGIEGDIPLSGKIFSASNDSLIIWRPKETIFYIWPLLTQPIPQLQLRKGLPTDIPLTGDLFGSGIDLLILFRDGVWFIFDMNDQINDSHIYGIAGDIPLVGDFMNLKRKQIGVYRPSTSTFFFTDIASKITGGFQWGIKGDIPIVGDWLNKGYDQLGVFRPSTGVWYIKDYVEKTEIGIQWGMEGDIPLEGDFGIAVYRPSNKTFYIKDRNNITFGNLGDIPLSGLISYQRMKLLNLIS